MTEFEIQLAKAWAEHKRRFPRKGNGTATQEREFRSAFTAGWDATMVDDAATEGLEG